MNDTRWLELWGRRTAGGELTVEEDRELAELLARDEQTLARLLDDDSVERDLTMLGRATRDEERFVAQVMSKVGARSNPSEPAAPPVAARRDLATEPIAPPAPARLAPSLPLAPRAPRGAIRRRVLAATAACLLLLAGFFLGRLSREPAARDMTDAASSQEREPVASVRRSKRSEPIAAGEALWRTGGPRGEVLPVGLHELSRGAARFALNDELDAELVAPATLELRPDRELALRAGKFRLVGALHGDSLRIATPVSRLSELAGDAELEVAGDGATNAVIRRGTMSLEERLGEHARVEPLRLAHGQFDHARIFAPIEPTSGAPLATELTGADERFLGRILLDGQALEFRSAEVFATTRAHVDRRFQQAPEELHRLWTQLAATVGGTAGAPTSITINGRRFSAQSADEMIESLENRTRRIQEEPQAASDETDGTFHAILVINGQTRTFRSRAAFEAASRELLAPWRQLNGPP